MKWVEKGGKGRKYHSRSAMTGRQSLKETVIIQLNPVPRLKLVTNLPASLPVPFQYKPPRKNQWFPEPTGLCYKVSPV